MLIPIVRRAAARLEGLLDREKETVQRLEELHDMKDTFLTAVSRELRTPLTVLKAGAQTLQRHDGALDPELRTGLVERIAVNADRLDHLLSSLLDLDRLGRGTVEPSREPVELDRLVDRVMGALAPSRSVSVDVPTVRVEVDAAQIERAVEILVTNALRHTPEDGAVHIGADVEDDHAVLRIDDDGPGVPDELKTRIFEPFVQGTLLRPESPGTGVGLALVHRFAALNGGRAWVEDRPGGGASFRLSLPRSPAAGRPTDDAGLEAVSGA